MALLPNTLFVANIDTIATEKSIMFFLLNAIPNACNIYLLSDIRLFRQNIITDAMVAMNSSDIVSMLFNIIVCMAVGFLISIYRVAVNVVVDGFYAFAKFIKNAYDFRCIIFI